MLKSTLISMNALTYFRDISRCYKAPKSLNRPAKHTLRQEAPFPFLLAPAKFFKS